MGWFAIPTLATAVVGLCAKVVTASPCNCTGQGHGSNGLTRGFPEDYGTACAAWDDGDCSAHACGTLQQCEELWPHALSGAWCCQSWCYVSPSCALPDVQPSTIDTAAETLYYSYVACESHTPTYSRDDCPQQQDISFEAAAAAIVVSETMGRIRAHDHLGTLGVSVVAREDGRELAITAGNDAKLCVFTLRSYGGAFSFCTPPAAYPVISFAATANWVATATEGHTTLEFWSINDEAEPSLSPLGQIPNATNGPIRYLKYLEGVGLLSSSEDHMVSVWDIDEAAANVSSQIPESVLGPFSWAPTALELVTFGQQSGVACGVYGDIEIWIKRGDSTWAQLTRLSGHSRLVTGLAFLPALGLLASSSLDSSLALWRFTAGQWALATYLYDHNKPVKALVWVPSGPLLASGDEESLILWHPAKEPTCEFSYTKAYYLPGFNRYELAPQTATHCRKLCCENAWCQSFDYAYRGDDRTHGPETCWLSNAAEGKNGGGGLSWDQTANYDYYEISKRGTRFMTLEQPKGISALVLAKDSGLLLSTNDGDGFVDVWKLATTSCPDGQKPKGDGASCVLCPVGRAGRGGICPVCRPGSIATQEGLTECAQCPPGKSQRGIAGFECTDCEAGTYTDKNGTDRCTACGKGYFAGTGATTCAPCSPGRFQPGTVGIQCFDCQVGTYSDMSGADGCTPCGIGYASDAIGATAPSTCKHCPKGSFSESTGQASCHQCPTGKAHDLFASRSSSDCTSCALCGTASGGLGGPCPVPKDGACVDCPQGMVFSTDASCAYCPLGLFPNSRAFAEVCNSFQTGDFDAVPDPNKRICHRRSRYKEYKCPAIMSGGWGNAKPQDISWAKYLDLWEEEVRACSALHCMGAFYEMSAIVSRQTGEECAPDESLRELCSWSLQRLNDDIAEREAAARRVEDETLFNLQHRQCLWDCNCQDICDAVTQEEDAAEDAFDVLPFQVVSCGVTGLTCSAECRSKRPVKNVNRSWSCLIYEQVSTIVVRKTHLPRCDAQCDECPSPSKYDSFSSYASCASIPSEGKKASLSFILGGIIPLLGVLLWCS